MKKGKKVLSELRSNKWSNDTLSHLSMKDYVSLCDQSVGDDEIAKSAMMTRTLSHFLVQPKNMIIATDKQIIISRKSEGIRYKNVYLDYKDLLKLSVSQDYYMHSRIYVSFRYRTKFLGLIPWNKSISLEALDVTSTFHFKKFVDQKRKSSNL